MENENIIQVKGLYAGFGEKTILSDVDFTAKKGEITIILGGSGSGKTTLLKHLLGLLPVKKGEVEVLGKKIKQIDEEQFKDLYLQMGVFYQNGALLNSYTVRENIALPLEQHTDLPPYLIEEIVRMKLGLVDLEDAFYLYPSELSGGMLKRAALARAIIMDPPLLFCDEPGAGLDPVSLAKLDNLILNLKEQMGITIVMVTHEVPSIKRLANKILFLGKGKVIFHGTLEEALKSDVKEVADFFKKSKGE